MPSYKACGWQYGIFWIQRIDMKNFFLFVKTKDLFTELTASIVTASAFWNMYQGEDGKALLFIVLLIPLELERIADRLGDK